MDLSDAGQKSRELTPPESPNSNRVCERSFSRGPEILQARAEGV